MMASPLDKARRDPEGMKARILKAARRVFGTYGFHGTTTRMIAKEVGVDISTLYYHWGEKGDLYGAVVLDIYEDLRGKLMEVEKVIRGRPLGQRMAISIELMTDYLFEHPEISNLILFRYFTRTRHDEEFDFRVPELISDIALSMRLAPRKREVPVEAKMQVLAIMNAIHNFISGEGFFRPMLRIGREEYVSRVKETLKAILIPAFSEAEEKDPETSNPLPTGRR